MRGTESNFVSTKGLHYGIIGATLPDLRDRLGVRQEDIALMLMGKSCGFLSGAIIGGFLFRIFHRHGDLLIFIGLIVYGLAMAGVPYAPSLELTIALYSMVGVAEGVKNTGGNTMVLHLWEDKAAIPMNIMLCGVGLGSFLSPQIAKAFMGDHKPMLETTKNQSMMSMNGVGVYDQQPLFVDMEYHGTFRNATLDSVDQSQSPMNYIVPENESSFYIDTIHSEEHGLQMAYIVVAGLIFTTALAQFILVIIGPPKGFSTWTPGPKGNTLKQMMNPGSCANGSSCYSLQLLSLLFLFYFFTGGAIKSFCNFLYSFATEGSIQMHRTEASNLNSAFWIFYMCGRGLVAPITLIVPLWILLLTSCFTNVLTGVVFSFFTADSSLTLWICTCIFGMSSALLQPNCMAWANLYLNMNSMATMVLLSGISAGDFAFSAVAGVCYDIYGPDSVKYVSAVSCVCLFVVFIIMQLVGHFNRGVVKEVMVVEVESGLMKDGKADCKGERM